MSIKSGNTKKCKGKQDGEHPFWRGGEGGGTRVGVRGQSESLSVLCQLPSVCQSTSQKVWGLCPPLSPYWLLDTNTHTYTSPFSQARTLFGDIFHSDTHANILLSIHGGSFGHKWTHCMRFVLYRGPFRLKNLFIRHQHGPSNRELSLLAPYFF